jgi:hypothetical protein
MPTYSEIPTVLQFRQDCDQGYVSSDWVMGSRPQGPRGTLVMGGHRTSQGDVSVGNWVMGRRPQGPLVMGGHRTSQGDVSVRNWVRGRRPQGSHGTPVIGRHRPTEQIALDTLFELLGKYHDHESFPFRALERLDCLGQIYLTCRFRLKHYLGEDRAKPAVQALFEVCKRKLSEIFGCTEEGLKGEVKEMYGTSRFVDWDKIDERWKTMGEGEEPYWPKRSVTNKYRLVFRGGLAYMLDWHVNWETPKRVLAKSEHAANPRVITPGFAGYVLVLGNRILMAQHREGESSHDPQQGKFAHSFYTEGGAILCAGEIAIDKGKVIAVSNSSGHYRPTADKLMHVLRCLRLNAVSLQDVIVNARTDQVSPWYRAVDFFASGGGVLDGLTPLTREQLIGIVSVLPGWMKGMKEAYKKEIGYELTDQEVLEQFY